MRNWLKGLMVTGALLAGCGGTEAGTDEPAAQPAPEHGQVQGMLYPAYDEALHCVVRTSSVRCGSGMNMYAYWDASVGYYIERNICSGRGGPIICPY
ncbi:MULTISPECIES: hypothetical protein [Myxococcus]|uniref:Lipoprotein n=1 Tax=Myxococcus llanfairpwllgwyngyllgogerychwyrndrobwllllantysiliogogogochensis TaxID=2590453 RepID=A0A540X1M0_9BACT|nr:MULTISPECIES: hypothetical protein [Myxococcus]NTX06020.1 hypothetical protein [Myxococcus sp. CA040A]TQF15167.1 hypothetical protein FJV41_14800 [Myxococcus llanfairpwllgwyngyllgogerychwyrndrobwllllantysiliogogogochensis]